MPDLALLDHPPVSKPNRVDVAKALKLRLQGATLPDIAALQGVTKQAVYQALTKFEPFIAGLAPGQLTAYSENRAEMFNVVEAHLTASLLDPDALSKASLNNRAYAFKQIHEARRLEQGQSTSNQALSILGKLVIAAEEKIGPVPPVGQNATGQPKAAAQAGRVLSDLQAGPDTSRPDNKELPR